MARTRPKEEMHARPERFVRIDRTAVLTSVDMTSAADDIVPLYERHAGDFARERGRSLFEKPWLDRFLSFVPPGGTVLDIGCGCGEPISRYIADEKRSVTGVDSSPAMISLCRKGLPDQRWMVCDMRKLSLGSRFDGLLAWDSFFHLTRDDQRLMFPIFAAHAAPGAPLMFTSGPEDGEAMGTYHGEPLYHASLDASEYEKLLSENGFEVVAHVVDDPGCGDRTIWLARSALRQS